MTSEKCRTVLINRFTLFALMSHYSTLCESYKKLLNKKIFWCSFFFCVLHFVISVEEFFWKIVNFFVLFFRLSCISKHIFTTEKNKLYERKTEKPVKWMWKYFSVTKLIRKLMIYFVIVSTIFNFYTCKAIILDFFSMFLNRLSVKFLHKVIFEIKSNALEKDNFFLSRKLLHNCDRCLRKITKSVLCMIKFILIIFTNHEK